MFVWKVTNISCRNIREAFASFGEEKWRAKFLLKRHIDLDEVIF